MYRAALLTLAAVTALGLASPAQAAAADPSRSRVEAQAPLMAPGVWGSAPLYGTMDRSGAFQLTAPTAGIQTGNAFYDAVLKKVLGGSVALQAGPLQVASKRGTFRRGVAQASVRAGAAAARLPLTVRTVEGPAGTTLRTYFSVSLAQYGVVNPAGGSPGTVRIAITAFFPR